MIDARFRPLPKWTEKTPLEQLRSQFRATFFKTLNLLEYELKKVSATNIVIEAGFRLEDIRNDGWPRSSATAYHPGVILYFNSSEGPLRFPCGTYRGWGDNLHAIALTLENLRAIDRYGVTLGHQQYMGFKALPAADPEAELAAAAAYIALLSGEISSLIRGDVDTYRAAYRRACAKAHPDITGNRQSWDRLQTCKNLLDRHFGIERTQETTR